MQMEFRKILIIAICIMVFVCLIIISINFVFDLQLFSSKTQTKKSTSISIDLSGTGIESKKQVHKVPRKLKPSNPSKYGMVIKNKIMKPETQEQWNVEIDKKIFDAIHRVDIDTREKIYAVIEEDPERTEEKIKQIDDIIKECDAKLAENPQDLEAKARKERLMMLKAIANSFKQGRL